MHQKTLERRLVGRLLEARFPCEAKSNAKCVCVCVFFSQFLTRENWGKPKKIGRKGLGERRGAEVVQ